MMQEEVMLTVQEIVKRCRVNRMTVSRWITEGRLPAYRYGSGPYRIKLSDFEVFEAKARTDNKEGANNE